MVANWAYSPTPTVTMVATCRPPLETRPRRTAPTLAISRFGSVRLRRSSWCCRRPVLPAGSLTASRPGTRRRWGSARLRRRGTSSPRYVLRPTGNPGRVLGGLRQRGADRAPSVNPLGEVVTFGVPPLAVLAGDVIGFHGQGVPLDTGGANADILSYPAPAGPVQGSTITLGAGGFPIYSTDRTYSLAATVEVGGSQTLTGGIRKFVDGLPGLGSAAANNLGQYIPVASPTPPPPGVPDRRRLLRDRPGGIPGADAQ